jgi:hypothetical protein
MTLTFYDYLKQNNPAPKTKFQSPQLTRTSTEEEEINIDPKLQDQASKEFDNDKSHQESPQQSQPEDSKSDQGVLRKVKNAHLVYKRKTETGTFEELWTFNVQKGLRDEVAIQRDILSATDIPSNALKSEDGKQEAELWTVGNIQMLKITGVVA